MTRLCEHVQTCTHLEGGDMREQQPMTQVMKAADVRANWSDVVDRVFRGKARVVVERSGIPATAVISAEDLDRLSRLDAQRADAFKVLDRIGEAFKDVSPEELRREVDKAVSEVRQEMAEERLAAQEK